MSLPCTLESVENLGASSFLVRLRPASELAFRAGQYLKLGVADPRQPVEGYFSIASPPECDRLELIVGLGAPDSAAARLLRMQPGEQVSIEGPFGDFVFQPTPHRHACFISHGTGISPLLSMFRSRAFAESAPLSTTFLMGYRNELEIIGMGAFGPDLPKARLLVTLSRPAQAGWAGLQGRVTDHLRMETLSIDWKQTEFYLCGSNEMVADVRSLLAAKGVAAASIHVL
jgi:ferredoxin-NADP reductase